MWNNVESLWSFLPLLFETHYNIQTKEQNQPLQFPCFILARILHFSKILASSWNYHLLRNYHRFKGCDEYRYIPILFLLVIIRQGPLPELTPGPGARAATLALKDRTLLLRQLREGNGYSEVPQHRSSSVLQFPCPYSWEWQRHLEGQMDQSSEFWMTQTVTHPFG